MTETILTASGIPHRPVRYLSPPVVTYAVYLDDVTTDGPDGLPLIYQHDVTVELYEPQQDNQAEDALEAALSAAGLHWTKQARYWLQNVQRYQVIYEFTYFEKRRA